jgi:hypothetical protein
MIVDKGIVLADFSYHVVYLLIRSESQECFFNVEIFFLDFCRHHNVIVILVCDEQELLDES